MSLISIINEFTVSNMEEAIRFYQDVFDFEIEFMDGNPVSWVQMKKDHMRLMLEDYQSVKKEIPGFPQKANSSNLVKFEYDNFDEFYSFYEKCKTSQCEFFLDYTETDYGKLEFGVLDCDHNMILVSFKKS